MKDTISRAIREAGGPVAVARAFGVTHAAVRKWALNGVPAERALLLAKLSGVAVHDLRPDIYPRDVTAGIGTDTNHGSVIVAGVPA